MSTVIFYIPEPDPVKNHDKVAGQKTKVIVRLVLTCDSRSARDVFL